MHPLVEKLLAALQRALSAGLLLLGIVAALFLALFGRVSESQVAWLLLLFAAARGIQLVLLLRAAVDSGGSASPRRTRREIACEGLGLVAFGLLLPLCFELFTSEIVSLRSGLDWTATAATLLCVALYAWPHWWSDGAGRAEWRELWWGGPFAPSVLAVVVGVALHHPYLNPFRQDRVALKADRVLSLAGNVTAGKHADWVFAHALALEERGEWSEAREYYRRGVRLAPQDAAARVRLLALEERLAPVASTHLAKPLDPRPQARSLAADAFARLGYWNEGQRPMRPRSCALDASLERVAETTVVIVALGKVPASITDAVGDVIARETGLSVCLVEQAIGLPAATRYRGVVFGKQWSVESLADTFSGTLEAFSRAPLRFLLVTGADIYSGDSNFVFSTTYVWGAVLSYARYEHFGSPQYTIEHRAAKQALGAIVKSFDLPASPDPNCVTSYSNGLPEFDAKGNRPTTETFLRMRSQIDAIDRQWRQIRASRPAG